MSVARWTIGVVAAVAVLALALWLYRSPAGAPSSRVDARLSLKSAPTNGTWPTWLFQFAIYFTANVTVNSTAATMATGAELSVLSAACKKN
jgi:hypothetical protein